MRQQRAGDVEGYQTVALRRSSHRKEPAADVLVPRRAPFLEGQLLLDGHLTLLTRSQVEPGSATEGPI